MGYRSLFKRSTPPLSSALVRLHLSRDYTPHAPIAAPITVYAGETPVLTSKYSRSCRDAVRVAARVTNASPNAFTARFGHDTYSEPPAPVWLVRYTTGKGKRLARHSMRVDARTSAAAIRECLRCHDGAEIIGAEIIA